MLNKNQAAKFYVTTPIYYPTAKPHLGSLYSTLLADVAARWHQLQGAQVYFLTGTDEHGQKIAQAAERAGVTPQQLVDQLAGEYQQLWHKYGINYTKFIRTTDPAHTQAVQAWLQKLIDRNLIYKANYEGYYCTPCETFVTETAVREQQAENLTPGSATLTNPLTPSPGHPDQSPGHPERSRGTRGSPSVLCPSCQRPTSYLSEENYFFRLSKYQAKLLEFYRAHPHFITPKERLNEVIKFVESGLHDLCLSRSTVTWGIKFPGDERHVTYVWADALNNYISAVGYGDPARTTEFNFWWPADLQVMGKDIVRFHAVYWPAFLMASDLPLPKQLLVHGWLKFNDQKMSKSLGNTIDPELLLQTYGADPVRYYLVSQMAITRDSEFSISDLEQKISSDLANDLGNLLNRTVQLAAQNNCTNLAVITNWSPAAQQLQTQVLETIKLYTQHMQANYYYLACAELWKLIKLANAFFHEQAPWVLAKTDYNQFVMVLSAVCHVLRNVAILSWPVIPQKASELLARLGINDNMGSDLNCPAVAFHSTLRVTKNRLAQAGWDLSFNLQAGAPLFARYDHKPKNSPENIAESTHMATTNSDSANPTITTNFSNNSGHTGPVATNSPVSSPEYISITEFSKIELVVGTIIACEAIAKSDKLYKLQVDCGTYGIRQILSGIKQHYSPADLLDRQAVFVLNLPPRQMLGLESQGMLLTAKDAQGQPQRVVPSSTVPNGTRLA